MKNQIIQTKQCTGCGAHIASRLQNCPYCDMEQTDYSLIPQEAREQLLLEIRNIEIKLAQHSFSRKPDYLAWITVVGLLLFPLLLAGGLYTLYANWLLSGVFFAGAATITYIRIKSSNLRFLSGDIFESLHWKFFLKRKVKKVLRNYDLPMAAYYEITLDYLQNKEVQRDSDLGITFE